MIDPIYNRTSSDTRMTAEDMNRICANINELFGTASTTVSYRQVSIPDGTATTEDPLGLAGSEYVILSNGTISGSQYSVLPELVTKSGSVCGLGILKTSVSSGELSSAESGKSLVTWTFEPAGDGNYYISTTANGYVQYIHIATSGNGADVTLTDASSRMPLYVRLLDGNKIAIMNPTTVSNNNATLDFFLKTSDAPNRFAAWGGSKTGTINANRQFFLGKKVVTTVSGGGSLRTDWTSDDIVDEDTWLSICRLAAALGRYPVTEDADYINVNYIERSLFDQYDATHHITASPKLTSLSISNGSLSPTFSASTYSYTAMVSDLTSVIAATTDYSTIRYTVNGMTADPAEVTWQPGANTLQVTATLNGQTVVYTVTVTCTYQAAQLLSLSIGGNPIPVEDNMSLTTENAADSISYTANGAVSLELNGEEVTGENLTWLEDDNLLTITVTADDVRVYTLAADCLYEAPLPALVSSIQISEARLSPHFDPGAITYVVYPDDEVSVITVVAEADIDASIYFNGTKIENGSEITWTASGGDIITVVTSGGAGYTPVTYTLTARAKISTTSLGFMRSGEIIAGDRLPGIEVST